MHVKNAPAAAAFSAHGHSVPDHMVSGRIEEVVVAVPERVAVDFRFVQRSVIGKVGSKFEVALSHVLEHLLATLELPVGSVKDDLRVKAVGELLCFSLLER